MFSVYMETFLVLIENALGCYDFKVSQQKDCNQIPLNNQSVVRKCHFSRQQTLELKITFISVHSLP